MNKSEMNGRLKYLVIKQQIYLLKQSEFRPNVIYMINYQFLYNEFFSLTLPLKDVKIQVSRKMSIETNKKLEIL